MLEAQLDASVAMFILLGFGLLWVAFGWFLGRNNRSIDDFALAGRNVGLAFATATAMATWITSNTTLVAPQLTYQFGVWGMVGYSMAALGLLLFAPMAARIKALMPHGFTSGDFIRTRYGKSAWWVFMLISLCYAIGWLVSLGMAGGILLSSLSDLDYHTGMSAILLICVLYTLLGGLKAVIATDFVQSLLILAGVLIIAWVCIDTVGISEIHSKVSEWQPELLNLAFPAAIMFLFNNIFFGIGEIFHSNVWWSRAFAFKAGIGRRAYFTAGLLWLPIPIVTGFIALSAMSLGIVPPSADMVGPLVAAKLLGSIGAVFVFVVVFSALASSMDSLLAATSDLLTQDGYKRLLRPKAASDELLKANKWIVVGLGVVTWLLCLPKMATLGALLNFTGAFVASTIFPIVFGLYHPGLTGRFAAAAMALGTLCSLILYFSIGFYVAAISSCLVSFAVCLLGLWLKPGRFDWRLFKEAKDVSQ
ncbi:sodium:solute symporter family protein [Aliiglaciecola sp. CAU 1673]|uniref:sodium:solute symporter family protein n=1 Tax=Aliiglaciecola sp. CAU 1673 TaxID=3032595 RepID=UPI0023DB81AD|nr:sodium:solute symporter family protein [Aliiglaciecola sp. CAU 1673]MDF2179435.1 sodium:solute symporter family protein [Aliiglaciecola sp. CAU 1673]